MVELIFRHNGTKGHIAVYGPGCFIQCHKEFSMELDNILYKESSLWNFYNYTIKFPTEEKYIQRDFLT
jgi:hypothetical protein